MRLLFLQQWFSDEVLKATGWTLIHSLWQGILAAVLAGIIIISTRKSEARLRYNLLGAVLVLFMITAVITFSKQLDDRAATEISFIDVAGSVSGTTFTGDNYETARTPAGLTMDKFVGYFNTNADFFVLIWAIFFLFHCIKLATGFAGIQRIRNYKTHASPEVWRSKLDQLSKSLGITRHVSLLQSELVKVPIAIGFLKPVILVPLGLLAHLPPEQAETILLHELAHIRRKDYLVNIVQRFTEAVFFFNPALLWISSLIRQEREACCDDIVVANTTNKGSYLEALVSFQEYSLAASGYAMAITTKRHYLLNRVKRMVTRENKKLDIMEKLLLIIGLIAFTAFTFIPKEESIDKKKNNVTIIEPVKTQGEPGPAIIPVSRITSSAPAVVRKPAVKKVTTKPAFEVLISVPRADTVPREKPTDNIKNFTSMSSTINDDGNNRTEVTTVVDQDGKKYSYTRQNNKVTSLAINDKAVPENEIGNYSELFNRIDKTRAENKVRKEKLAREADKLKREQEKLEREENKLKDELKREKEKMKREEGEQKNEMKREKEKIEKAKSMIKIQENRTDRQRDEISRKAEDRKRKFDDQQRINQKRYDEKMKRLDAERERERINREKERIIRNRELNKSGKRRTEPSGINAMELIKKDIHVENSATVSLQITTEINNETNGKLKFSKNQSGMTLKFEPNIHIQKDLSKKIEFISGNKELKLFRCENEPTKNAEPRIPGKPSSPDIKPLKEAQPVKFKMSLELFRKKITA